MKKNYFFLAAAALAFASCSVDETLEVNQGEAIGFRTNLNGITRAYSAGPITAFAEGDKFNVYADFGSAKYFQDDFTLGTDPNSGFWSATKYYWPSDISSTKKMTFTAVFGGTQTAGTPGQVADFTPAAAAASQVDLLVAQHQSSAKETPVVLNFRHALSQIVVKVANSEANFKITVSGVRVGYVAQTGTLNYAGGVTDTKNSGFMDQNNWSNTAATGADANKYDQTVSATLQGKVTTATELTSYAPWLLLPQTLTAASEYTTASSAGVATDAPDFNGAYIALKMTIENWNGAAVTGTVVSEQWCYWPIGTDWIPGKKYTYTINAGSGGYQPTDTDDNKTTLTPVLDNNVIWFSPSCTIDDWSDATAIEVDAPAA